MESGVIVEEGTPQQVIEHPQDERTRRFLRSLLKDDGVDYDYSI